MATKFSRYNQPRTCAECGKSYSDSDRRDVGELVCADCYEIAGIVNEHLDGFHKDAPDQDCPDCRVNDDARISTVLTVDAGVSYDDDDDLTISTVLSADDGVSYDDDDAHFAGAHGAVLDDNCKRCEAIAIARVQADSDEDDDLPTAPTQEQNVADMLVGLAESRIQVRLSDMAERLRRMADRIDQDGARLTMPDRYHDAYGPSDDAAAIVADLAGLPANLRAHDLILDAIRLERAQANRRALD